MILFLLLPLFVLAQSREDSLAFVSADWQRTALGKGAESAVGQIQMFGSTQSISIVKYPLRKFRSVMLHSPGDAASATDRLAMDCGAVAAVNGSYFNMKTLEPHTFFSINGRIVGRTPEKELLRSNGVLAFKNRKGSRMEIFEYDSTKVDEVSRKYYSALAAGPILMIDGVDAPFDAERAFNYTRHPRTFFGWNRVTGEAYMVVVDGRFPGQADGASITELVALCHLLGLTDAINLDGGGSSTVWSAETGVLNHPYDNKRFDHEGCRAIPNIIYIK